MPDPIEELESFDTRGLTVNPLPASEVRRRGTRLRRRNHALAAVAGAAAVAVIAVPLALGATGGDRVDNPPITSPSGTTDGPTDGPTDGTAVRWRQAVPADFPLTEGMPATHGDDGSPVRVVPTSGLDDLVLCGTPGWSPAGPPPTVDLAGAAYRGESEDSQARTLALYADAEAAGKALGALESAVRSCPVDTAGGRADQVYAVEESDLGEASLVFTQRSQDDAGFMGDLSVYQVVRVGNAVLLATSYGQGGADRQVIDYSTQRLARGSASVVSDLCVFAAEPC